jgi:hypothetical protein
MDSERMMDYNKFLNRKRISIPFWPNAMNVNQALGRSTTTTAVFQATGAVMATIQDIGATYKNGVLLTTNTQAVNLEWRVPDDFYPGDETHVWLVFAKEASTTTCVFSYDVLYTASKIVEYGGSGTAEALADGSTAMDTDLDQALTLTGLTRRSLYRGMRGVIAAGKIDVNDAVNFKLRVDAAPTGDGQIYAHSLEVEYSIRLRERGWEEYK